MIPAGVLERRPTKTAHQAITNPRSGYLSFAEEVSPLTQVVVGTASLLKDTSWAVPQPGLPDPHVFSGIKYAGIYVSRHWNGGKGGLSVRGQRV